MDLDKIIQHDVTQPFPLSDECIDVIFTSPPYWGLRDYGIKSIFGGDPNCHHDFSEYDAKLVHENRQNLDGGTIGNAEFREKLHGFGDAKAGFCSKCGAWEGQLGLEPHPQMYIDHLVMICQEIKRVLKKSGSFYLNLGDTYGGSGRGYRSAPDPKWEKARDGKLKPSKVHDGNWLQPKQLLGIPERVMIALQDDGWILRNKNVWHKLNSMPSSVKDRLNNTWEPVFHFVKARKYYFDLDVIREPHKASSLDRAKYGFNLIPRAWEQEVIPVSGGKKVNIDCHPAGKNPGDIIQYDGKFKDKSKHFESVSERKNYERQVLGVPHDLATSHPNGKNPGDVVKHDIAVGRIGNFSYNNPLHTKEYNPNGKNPGDVLQFDEEYWWNFILGRAHSNRFYKKAYEIMKEWMVENNCFDYNIFYEWYKKEFKGMWESGNLEKGKANYLSDVKTLPFPKPETRFLGDIPGDFWSITTQPFTGYNPDLEHFAVFPESLVEKPLKASCPKLVCKKCGKPKRQIARSGGYKEAFNIRVRDVKEGRIKHTDRKASKDEVENYDEGEYVSKVKKHVIASGCSCNAGFRPGVVLDPFCGRGTVGKVAKRLGLHYILFDIKPEYCELARLFIGGQKHKIPKGQSSLDVFGYV